jgi:TPR repeat protein
MDCAPKFALTARQSRLRCAGVPIPTRDVHVMRSAGSLFFLALAFALAMPAPAQAARLDNGFRAGDHPRAVKSVGPAAERGDARAQARLGFMYQYGRGVPQNYRLAYYWYRRGAEQGNAAAQHLLGLLYDKGQGTLTDHVLAHMWLSLAAAATKGAEHEDNVRLRNAVASKMSLGQLSDAQSLAVSWVPKPER